MEVGDMVRWKACDWSEEYKQKYCARGFVMDITFAHDLDKWYSHNRNDCKWHPGGEVEVISAGR